MSTVPVWQASDQELLAELRALESRLHSTWADMVSVVAEVDFRGTATVGYGELPTEGGERPQIVVTVSLAVLRSGVRCSCGMVVALFRGVLCPVVGAIFIMSSIGPRSNPLHTIPDLVGIRE